jgi:hypothetical protein
MLQAGWSHSVQETVYILIKNIDRNTVRYRMTSYVTEKQGQKCAYISVLLGLVTAM